jgi:hypothetical protein
MYDDDSLRTPVIFTTIFLSLLCAKDDVRTSVGANSSHNTKY